MVKALSYLPSNKNRPFRSIDEVGIAMHGDVEIEVRDRGSNGDGLARNLKVRNDKWSMCVYCRYGLSLGSIAAMV